VPHESSKYAKRDLGKTVMEFRLVYEGELLAEKPFPDSRQPRLKHKQRIRRHFHEQLRELWNIDSRLKSLAAGGRTEARRVPQIALFYLGV
jgi:hypothetical protein